MASKAAPKPGRSVGKSTVKTPGKDQTKGDKQPTSVLEIVPGKFNENDWLSLLENDDTEDFIADIFEGIWLDVSKKIEEIHIGRQLLPYTVMITENALSNVIQWAFLERDEPKPADGNFWEEDSEPTPCTMDNWGEGVVPSCREEHQPNIDASAMIIPDQTPRVETILEVSNEDELTNGPSARSSTEHLVHSSRSNVETKKNEKLKPNDRKAMSQETESFRDQEKSLSIRSDNIPAVASERQRYHHDVLVIDTQPPKLEPLANLFFPTPIRTNESSSLNPTPATLISKSRRFPGAKATSQLGSDDLASTTNLTETTGGKSFKKHESKLFDDQHVEEIIAKAPVAAHAILKSILSRPAGYRELELDDFGNVIAIAKLDPDKMGPRSVRVKCDVVKPRKAVIESRTQPAKPSPLIRASRSDPKFAPVKLVLPEQSTEVGDLIQPVPGVLYEDSKLKKGDPRRYQTGLSKYTNFIDDSRPLRPIARRGDLAVLQIANDLLRKSKDSNVNNDNGGEPSVPKLHRLSRIPPIMSGSSTSSA